MVWDYLVKCTQWSSSSGDAAVGRLGDPFTRVLKLSMLRSVLKNNRLVHVFADNKRPRANSQPENLCLNPFVLDCVITP